MIIEEFLEFNEKVKSILGMDVIPSFKVKQNGELKTKLTGNGNINPFSYIRVEMPENVDGGWQNTHLHNHTIETSIVEKGCQIVIEQNEDDSYRIVVMNPGDIYSFKIGAKHNCYVTSGTITHTIEMTIGNNSLDSDYIPELELDEYLNSINQNELKREIEYLKNYL